MKNSVHLLVKDRELKNFILFEIQGEINMFTSPVVRDKLIQYYNGNKGIIIDLSEVYFMDSSGVATLVEGLSWSKKKNKEFILIGLGLNIYNALSLTKLENIFNIRARLAKPKSCQVPWHTPDSNLTQT